MSAAAAHQSPEMAKSLTIVNMMVERLGVKLLALDFDLTLLDIDTGGNKQTPEELARTHLRPCFRAIIAAGFKVGLQMCVVSYNHRKDLIAGVLKSAFPTVDTDDTVPVAVFKKSILHPKVKGEAAKRGKERQIAEVLKQLEEESDLEIEPHEIFLFDDVDANIQHAVKNKHLTYKVENDVTIDHIYCYVTALCSKDGCHLSLRCVDKVQGKRELSNGTENSPCARDGGRTPTQQHGRTANQLGLVTRVMVQQKEMHGWMKDGGVWRMRSAVVMAR